MQRAGQTPHGARPNREGARNFGSAHAPARRVKPPGRSLEPRSDAGPRGMAVAPERSGGQNSAYRSGCHKLLLSITSKANKARCDAGVTRLLGQRQRAFGNWNARQLFRQGQPANHSSERHNPGQRHDKRVIGTDLENEANFSIAPHPFLKRCPINVCRE